MLFFLGSLNTKHLCKKRRTKFEVNHNGCKPGSMLKALPGIEFWAKTCNCRVYWQPCALAMHSRVSVLQTSVGLQILHFDLRAMQLVRSFDRNFLDHFNLKTSPVSLIDFGFKIIHAWIGTWKFSCWSKRLMQKKLMQTQIVCTFAGRWSWWV